MHEKECNVTEEEGRAEHVVKIHRGISNPRANL